MTETFRRIDPVELAAMRPTRVLVLQVIREHGELPIGQLSEIIGKYQKADRQEPSELNFEPHNSLEDLVSGMSGRGGLLIKRGVNETTTFSVGFQGHRFLALHAPVSPQV